MNNEFYICDRNKKFMTIVNEQKKILTSPYILDGLVSMFDSRTPFSGTVWKNRIVTSGDATVKNAPVYDIVKKCITINKATYQQVQFPTPVLAEFTYEIVACVDWLTGFALNFFGGVNSLSTSNVKGMHLLLLRANGSVSMSYCAVAGTANVKYLDSSYIVERGKLYTFTVVIRSGAMDLYINGVVVTSFPVAGFLNQDAALMILGSGSVVNDHYRSSGDYYAGRFYNRVLTADEVARNHRADKDAFNF